MSYWDGGWVFLDVDDPLNPATSTDTTYPEAEPFLPRVSPPKGNAHQGEWSFDHQYRLATNEDFNLYGMIAEITDTGEEFVAIPVTDVPPIISPKLRRPVGPRGGQRPRRDPGLRVLLRRRLPRHRAW